MAKRRRTPIGSLHHAIIHQTDKHVKRLVDGLVGQAPCVSSHAIIHPALDQLRAAMLFGTDAEWS